MWGPAAGLEHGALGLEGGHPEVGHLDVVLVVEQKVLRLRSHSHITSMCGGQGIPKKETRKLISDSDKGRGGLKNPKT